MRGYDLARQVESKAQAGRWLLSQMRIRLKQQGQFVACDAVTVVAQFHDGVRTGPTRGHVDGWRFRGMLDGVREDVDEDLLQSTGIALDVDMSRRRRKLDRQRIRQSLGDFHRIAYDLHKIDRRGDELEPASLNAAHIKKGARRVHRSVWSAQVPGSRRCEPAVELPD